MSYGTIFQVAPLARVWTDNGSFHTTTNPTDVQVEEWLDQVSATADIALAMQGFVTPVTNTQATKALTLIVTSIVADLCHGANSSGRFFTENVIQRGLSPMVLIRQELANWVDENATGLEALGAERIPSPADKIGYRETDQRGNVVAPIFERDAFGNTFEEWDSNAGS